MSRRHQANSVVELPLLIFVAFAVLFFPLAGLATFASRAAFFYSATKSACLAASRQPSFSEARIAALSSIASASSAFSGLKLKDCQVSILTRALATNSVQESFSALPADTIDTQKDFYFIRIVGTASVAPLLPVQSTFGTGLSSIPGLCRPFEYRASTELLAEHPIGLSF
jgi:hypothetical protein